MNSRKKLFQIAVSTLVVTFSVYFVVVAWTEPSSVPPNGNVTVPISWYYRTTGTYNGAQAGTACATGYHICYANEWYGGEVNSSLGDGWTNPSQSAWISAGGICMGNTYWHTCPSGATPDCAGYTFTTDGGGDGTGYLGTVGYIAPSYTSANCTSSYKVMCCSN